MFSDFKIDSSKECVLPRSMSTRGMARGRYLALKVGAALSLFVFGLSMFSSSLESRYLRSYKLPNYLKAGTSGNTDLNTTLGFQKIYALNLPKRADKRDELAIMSYASDLEIEFVDAVNGADLKDKTIVEYPDTVLSGQLGCYRSHVDVLRKIVEDRVETALILEDDVDWDVDVRKGLVSIQKPLHTLIGNLKKDRVHRESTQSSPYGNSLDWDMIYLGACLETSWKVPGQNETAEQYPYVQYEDETAPDYTETTPSVKKVFEDYGLDIMGKPGGTEKARKRIIQRAKGPICLVSYAITRRGAARLLYILTRAINSPVDILMSWAVGDGRVEGYTVFPPLMDQWKIEGAGWKNSDITTNSAAGQLRKRAWPDIGSSWNVRNSIRKNLKSRILSNGGVRRY